MGDGRGGAARLNRFNRVVEPGRPSCPDTEVAHLLASGHTPTEVARIVRHVPSTVRKSAVRTAAGPYAPKQGGARRDVLGDDGREMLKALNARFPQHPQQWLADFITVALQKEVRVGVVQRALQRLQLTSKRFFVVYAEALNEDAVRGQKRHIQIVRTATQIDPTFPDGIFYLDFCSVNEDDRQSNRGRAPRGQGAVVVRPSGRALDSTTQNVDLVFAVNRKLGGVAPFAMEGHANATVVVKYLHRRLLPAIAQAVAPGGPLAGVEPTIILDGASYWAGTNALAVLRPLCRTFGCNLLFLPPYAPWLNPIEFVNGWVKQQFRAAALQVLPRAAPRGPDPNHAPAARAADRRMTAPLAPHAQSFAARSDPRALLEAIVMRVTPEKAAGFINHLWQL